MEDEIAQLHWESQRACFPPFASSSVYNSICLSLCVSVPCSFLPAHFNKRFCVSSFLQFPLFLPQTPGSKIHTLNWWGVNRGKVHMLMTMDSFWKKTSIWSALAALLCSSTFFVFNCQQSWVLSLSQHCSSHLHVGSVKEQGALSPSVSLYRPLTHKHTPFCTWMSVCARSPNDWLCLNSRIFNCPSLSPLL